MSQIYIVAKTNCSTCGIEGEMSIALIADRVFDHRFVVEIGKYDAPDGWEVRYDYEIKSIYCPECIKKEW